MALSTVLLLASGIGTHIGFQDPGFDLQFALPALEQSPIRDTTPVEYTVSPGAFLKTDTEAAQIPGTPVEAPIQGFPAFAQNHKTASVQFRSAKAGEVLMWLEKQGISFVLADGMIPSDASVTMNVVNQPVDDIAEALAAALGGHWQRANSIRVFRPGPGPQSFMPHGMMPGMPAMPAHPFGTAPMSPEAQKRMENMAKEFEMKFGPEFQRDMEKRFGPEFHKEMEKRFGPEFQREMEKKFGPEFQREMEKRLGAHAQEVEIIVEGKGGLMERRVLAPAKAANQHELVMTERALAGQQMARQKALREIELTLPALAKGQAVTVESLARTERAHVEAAKAAAKAGKIAIELTKQARGERAGTTVNVVDAQKFMSTLSLEQKHTMRTRGHLAFKDLTAEQRKLLGVQGDAKFEIKLISHGETVVVRG